MTVRYLRSIKSVQGIYPAPALIEPPKLNLDVFRQYQRIQNQASNSLLSLNMQNMQRMQQEKPDQESDTSDYESTTSTKAIFRPYQL